MMTSTLEGQAVFPESYPREHKRRSTWGNHGPWKDAQDLLRHELVRSLFLISLGPSFVSSGGKRKEKFRVQQAMPFPRASIARGLGTRSTVRKVDPKEKSRSRRALPFIVYFFRKSADDLVLRQ